MATGGLPTVLNSYITGERIRWCRVQERLQSHPREASDLDEYGRFLLNAILSRRMDDYPSVAIVKTFVEAYPPAIWCSSNIGGVPLSVACWRRAPLNILQFLADSRPSMPHDYNALNTLWDAYSTVFQKSGISLVDFVCEGGREGAEIWTKLYLLLRYCTDPRKNVSTWRGLHLAASSPTCPIDLFRLILSLNRGEAQRSNEKGQLPLHCLASAADQISQKEKLDLLLEEFPDAVRQQDADKLLPIHAAVIAGRPIEFINVLLRVAPETLAVRGGSDNLFPFQLAATSPKASMALTYHLLRAAPHLVAEEDLIDPVESTGNEQTMNAVPVPSDGDSIQSFIDIVDTVAHSLDYEAWKEMLGLLHMHEGHSSTPWTVIHGASSITTLCPAFLELVVRLYPEDLRQKDELGRVPLHIVSSLGADPIYHPAAEDNRESKIETILQGFPDAARFRDCYNSLPLHRAITSGQSWNALSSLIRAAPETLSRRDGVNKLYPFQLAACSPSARIDDVYQLLLSAPDLVIPQKI